MLPIIKITLLDILDCLVVCGWNQDVDSEQVKQMKANSRLTQDSTVSEWE